MGKREGFQETFKIGDHVVERSVYPLPQWEADHDDQSGTVLAWIERHAGRRYNCDLVVDAWERFTFDDVTLMELARVTDDLSQYLQAVDRRQRSLSRTTNPDE